MNQQNPTTPYTTLVVVGASGEIGREVARLGVAYGALVYGICRSGEPPTNEPWTQGVTWISADATTPEAFAELPDGPIVVAADIALPAGLAGTRRIVQLTRPGAGPSLADLADDFVIATPQQIDSSEIGDDFVINEATIRIETLGMALLRAALEDDVAPLLDQEALCHLGDAVMLQ